MPPEQKTYAQQVTDEQIIADINALTNIADLEQGVGLLVRHLRGSVEIRNAIDARRKLLYTEAVEALPLDELMGDTMLHRGHGETFHRALQARRIREQRARFAGMAPVDLIDALLQEFSCDMPTDEPILLAARERMAQIRIESQTPRPAVVRTAMLLLAARLEARYYDLARTDPTHYVIWVDVIAALRDGTWNTL